MAGILLFNLMVALLLTLTLYESRKEVGKQAEVRTQNLVRLLEHDIVASFDKIDLTLLAVVDEVNRLRGSGHLNASVLNAFIARQTARFPELAGLRVADARGELRYGTAVPSDIPVSIANRIFFMRLRDQPDAGLVISKPLVGRISGRWSIYLTRRLNQPDGSFAGIVIGAVELSQFTDRFAALNIGRNGIISLHDQEGTLVARHPALENEKNFNSQIHISAQLREQLKTAPQTGTFQAGAPIDHDERIFSYRKVTGYPFYVAVGLATADYLTAWWKDVAKNGVLLAIFVLVSLAFGWLMNRVVRNLRQQEQKFRVLLESSPYPLVIADAKGQIVLVNRQVVALFGYEPEELVGQPVELLLPQRYHSDHVVLRQGYTQTPQLREMGKNQLLWAVTKQGREVPINVSLSPIQTGEGLMVAAAILDISERHVAEEQLRIAAAAFESQQGMMITDADGVILRVNRVFTEITGYTAEEAVGQTPRLLQSGRHDKAFYSQMWETIRLTGGWQGEILDRRKNGEIYPKWLTITAVKSDLGVVTHYVGTHRDISEHKAAEEQIVFLAYHDVLTALPNRRLLLDRLQHALTTSARSGHHGALFFLDLDNFKTLNDTLGHDKGDLLLQQVGQRLATCVREGDTVARLGGDEFVVLLEELSEHSEEAASQSKTIGEKILATLSQPYLLAGHEALSTSSIGVALFSGHQAAIEELLKQADLAMYQAKNTGRNALRFFDPQMQTIVTDRAALEVDLREAVRQQQFILYYQAQVVGDGRLTGAEALVRWQHPQRGMVSPAKFIPLAEETNLILPLGQWVLETACAQLATWACQPNTAHLSLAVNVSAKQLQQTNFVEQVLAVLGKTGANPKRLKLELTESLLVSDVETTIAKMSALKAHGVGFSLDDFGTGYSSLTYLKRLPLDQLKIDQGFVRDILIDPNDAAIAKMVIILAESLGLLVIAEGVETEAQRDLLARMGCHAYQGYLFSRPLPLDEFEAFVHRV